MIKSHSKYVITSPSSKPINPLLLLLVSFIFFSCTDKKRSSTHHYVINDGRYFGFIDSTGKVILEPKYHFTGRFQEGMAIIFDSLGGAYHFINTKGDTILSPSRYTLTYWPIEFYKLRGVEGRFDSEMGRLAFEANEFSFSSGLALIYDAKKDRFGYMNKQGDVVIDTKYPNASKFYRGYAMVQTSYDSSNWENTRVGIIDSTGKFVIADKYYYISRLSNGRTIGTMVTKKGESYGFTSLLINKSGGVMNTVNPAQPCFFDEYSGLYCVGFNTFRSSFFGAGYFILDSSGSVLKDKRNGEDLYYEDISINAGKYIWYKVNGKYTWAIIDKEANLEVRDKKLYDTVSVGFNNEGLACVRYPTSDGKSLYGYIDTLGTFVIPPKFHTASNFRGPLAAAILKSGYMYITGYINKKGNFVWSREERDRGPFK